MNYEKGQDVAIVLLDMTLTVLKGIKKLHGLLKKKGQKLNKVKQLNIEINGTNISSSSEPSNG